MSAKDHPDYSEEVKRLVETRKAVEEWLGKAQSSRGEQRKQFKRAMKGLNVRDSSEGYIDLLVSGKLMDMLMRDEDRLQAIREKPYFCRIDFRPDGAGEYEKLYIGKTSLFRRDTQQPVIVDWRAPIATLYYEARPGPVSYSSETETVTGHLSLKRQYEIESGELVEIRDIDVTARDDLLAASLRKSADRRLNEIISTIQAEQNRVIRADLDFPLLVQGAAGSGKTTIALHRIAYCLYHRAETFDPEQMMILAPNRLFLGYVADVLPELGVLDVYQTTFPDFFREEVGKKMKLADPDQKLLRFIQREESEPTLLLEKWCSRFKGSMAFKEVVDAYIEEVLEQLAPREDFILGKKYLIRTKKEINRWLREDYAYLPIYRRLEKIRQVLGRELKRKTEEVVKQAEQYYDEKIEQARYRIRDPEKRRERVIHWMDRKEAVLAKIRKASASLLPRYMAAFRKKDVFSHYRELFRNEERFRSLSLPTENIRYLCQTASESLDRKQLEMEDTAALLYLKHRLYGIPNRRKIKHVVIDEAQDFSVFQIYALKEAIGTRIFTIFGDLAQGIHSYRGITDWQEVLDHVFPEDRCQFLTLEKSYRTTVEIMELANQIIGLMNAPGILPARPVVRHGDKPLIRLFDDPEEPVDWIRNELERAKNSGLRSVAVIGRSLRECRKIEKLLKRRTDWSLQLLTGESTFDDVDLIIVPAHTAKGLEFDLAILLMLDEPYTRDELDLKLLYVAMTRPLHRLAIFARNGMFPLLEALDPAKYCKKCR